MIDYLGANKLDYRAIFRHMQQRGLSKIYFLMCFLKSFLLNKKCSWFSNENSSLVYFVSWGRLFQARTDRKSSICWVTERLCLLGICAFLKLLVLRSVLWQEGCSTQEEKRLLYISCIVIAKSLNSSCSTFIILNKCFNWFNSAILFV